MRGDARGGEVGNEPLSELGKSGSISQHLLAINTYNAQLTLPTTGAKGMMDDNKVCEWRVRVDVK